MDPILVVFQLIILIFSVIIHEVSHGVVALGLGDPTAKLSGRLTLNPIVHLDLFGSIFLPFLSLLGTGGQLAFGYAKPVPYNPYLLKDQKWGPALVALAGPAANILLAIGIALVWRLTNLFYLVPGQITQLVVIALAVNVVLAVFNSVPIPPLDGSKIIAPFLPAAWLNSNFWRMLEQQGMLIVFLFILFGFAILSPLISLIIRLLLA